MAFTDFGTLAIISLLMGLITVRTIYYTVKNRKTLFDERFTMTDRQHMSMVAFFILVPISVLLHELGHAVAVWYYGGEVLTFGYFLFFGFVEHRGFYTPQEMFWIAAWGNIVSVVLGIGALAWAFLRPMRAAINYLLILFGMISILISLVFYPAMDLLSDLHGDWSQMYSWDTQELSIGTGILHGLILLGLVGAWQSNRVRLRFAELTGLRPEELRKVSQKDAEAELLSASNAALEDFSGLARAEAGKSQRGTATVLITWSSGGFHRTVVVAGVLNQQQRVEIFGVVRMLDGSDDAGQQRVSRIRGLPEPDVLKSHILKALKQVDRWEITRIREP